MSISREDTARVARLARLRLAPEELDRLPAQLSSIVDFIAQLSAAETDGIEPTSHVLGIVNALREDTARPCPAATQAAIMKNAPASEDGCYKVPRVIENQS